MYPRALPCLALSWHTTYCASVVSLSYYPCEAKLIAWPLDSTVFIACQIEMGKAVDWRLHFHFSHIRARPKFLHAVVKIRQSLSRLAPVNTHENRHATARPTTR